MSTYIPRQTLKTHVTENGSQFWICGDALEIRARGPKPRLKLLPAVENVVLPLSNSIRLVHTEVRRLEVQKQLLALRHGRVRQRAVRVVHDKEER